MQLFELVSPRLFRPLAGPTGRFMAELLLLAVGGVSPHGRITPSPGQKR